jgi:LPXTG-motif cell wall-anchored protein
MRGTRRVQCSTGRLLASFAAVVLFTIGLLAQTAGAATLTVTNTNAAGPGSLNQALADAAAAGADTITFASSTDGATIPSPSSIPPDTTLQGNGAGVTIIAGLINVNNAAGVVVADLSIDDINVNAGGGATTQATFSNVEVTGGINVNSGFAGASTTATFTDVDVADGINVNSGFDGSSTTATFSNVRVTGGNPGINANALDSTTTVTLTDVSVSGTSGDSLEANDDGTTVTVNRATFTGGEDGVDLSGGASVSLTNVTINGVADVGLDVNGTAALQNSNVTDNEGGGVVVDEDGTVTMGNSIVSGNAAFDDEGPGGQCTGTVTSTGGNIATDDSCGLTAEGDQPNTDPQLGPLATNGGALLTQLPQAGSPAVDRGRGPGCPGTDARLVARPQDGDGNGVAACDVGAVEVAGSTPVTTTTVAVTTTTQTGTPTTLGTTAPVTTAAPTLPATGAGRGTLPLAAGAGVLLASGVALVAGSRRRRQAG